MKTFLMSSLLDIFIRLNNYLLRIQQPIIKDVYLYYL